MKNKADTSNIILRKICQRINKINSKIEGVAGRKPEFVALILLFVVHCLITFFHEPCFDESHAWSIAKDGTIFQLLFEVPHYEGHPALWHLILMPFAKSGISMKAAFIIVTTFFYGINCWLILFKAPFCRSLRLLLPFTYFFVYQYSVVARPYCMLVTAIILLALLKENRDNKPGRYVAAMIFLCATSAFGVAISAGIAVEWVIQILKAYIKKQKRWRELVRDKRVYLFILLLVYALALLMRAMPKNSSGSISFNADGKNSLFLQTIYLLLGLVSDGFVTNSYTDGYLKDFEFMIPELIGACIIGALILGVISYTAKKYGTLMAFIIPYICYIFFSAKVYFCVYNSGIAVMIIVYWAWITVFECKNRENIKTVGEVECYKKDDKNSSSLREKISIAGALMFVIPLFWGITSCVMDIFLVYAFGEKEGQFLNQEAYSNYNICFDWSINSSGSQAKTLYDYGQKHIMKNIQLRAFVNPNRILNWPFDYSMDLFYQAPETAEEHNEICNNLIAHGLPDILIGEVPVEQLTETDIKKNIFSDYTNVYTSHVDKIWKGNLTSAQTGIYIRNDLIK